MSSVVFDIGNVLIDWDVRRIYRDRFPDDAAIAAFLDEIGFDTWNLDLDRGGTWADAVARHADRHPRRADLIAMADRDWQRSVSGPIRPATAALDRMAEAGVPLYAITNFSAEKWAETCLRFPFLATSFRDVVVSAHEGVAKPDPAIFRLFLDRNGLAAGECVFIDDSPVNVAGAAALGFDAILFDRTLRGDPDGLARQLRARGLPA